MAETLAQLVRELAADLPGAPAVTLGDTTRTFAELHERSSRVARALQTAGLGPGDRVGVLDKNAPTFYEVVFGAAKLGAVTVGLNFRLAAPEVADVVADAGVRLVVVDPEFAHLLPEGVPQVHLGEDYEAWLGEDRDPGWGGDADDVVLQLYSSGTTGRPKGAMLTSANLLWTPRMGREFYGMDEHTVNLVPSPLFHIGGAGYSLTALGQGGHTVLVRDMDPAAVLGLIEQHGVTHTFLVPAVVQMLAESAALPGTDLSSLRRIAYGAAPMGETQLLKAIALFGCDFMGVYGMTETSGSVVCLPPEDHDPGGPRAGLLRSVGKPLPWLELRVVDPATGADAAVGGVGEIWVRSGQNTVGYWGQPQLTAETITEDGWLRTGDAAYLDAEGYVFLHDRMKDMVVSGGENVYPAEVENVLYAHPEVLEAAVIGVPSHRWGETVKAVVVRRPGSTVDEPGLIAFVRDRLAHYKCPTSVDFADELPRNASGKVLKKVLREPFWSGSERQVH
ncbi:long-chain-fatty-acid--CoA ligase [Klenkia sp. PcliD-1-E]|uniref:long-chain-fatty-acid--CoA ligase n=1 Tax=Klenkia sp. PcliD-1-E TaxID=2954492 RepID=UPI002096A847|nr:long-chain-fatty-acid--CoA ligase [Klenkia sp. PcliD-1-E]MCO7219587.1 long-chain-fatty-acid--CoA ligase [Klenkia sp. PcliD-1-E]